MKDTGKTKKQLVQELTELHRKVTELQEREKKSQRAKEVLKSRLIEYDRLSALGRLTANVAHEIRNPITIIGGLARRLKMTVSPGTQEEEYIELISSEAKRLEDILRDVLTFSDKAIFHREEQDINRVLNESLSFYEDVCRDHLINIQKYFDDLPKVYIDKRLVKEAINNLISNAIDAMPDGGILTIRSNIDYLKEKNFVIIKISDTGTGIAEENMRLIFEPFFTTKATKKETGLGLSITKKIVEGHGGFIKVDSAIGKGSTFSLYFPYRALSHKL